MPDVSVIVPAYNAAASLARALESAFAQTHTDFEVILVDDASRDATPGIARALAAREPRLKVLRNEATAGPSASRNRALRVAEGTWIALLDADDAWLPERLERMLATGPQADVISDDIRIVVPGASAGGEACGLLEHKGLTLARSRYLSAEEFVRHDFGLMKPLMRRAFLEQHGLAYDEERRLGEDFVLYFELLAAGARWLQLPEGYYVYTRQPTSISNDLLALVEDKIDSIAGMRRHPAVARDGALATALMRQHLDWRGQLAFWTVRGLVQERRLSEVVKILAARPSFVPLIVRRLSANIYLRAIRRVRDPRRPTPARLLR